MQIKLIKRVLQLEQAGSDSETPVAYSALSTAYVVASPHREPSQKPEELDEELGEERFLREKSLLERKGQQFRRIRRHAIFNPLIRCHPQLPFSGRALVTGQANSSRASTQL